MFNISDTVSPPSFLSHSVPGFSPIVPHAFLPVQFPKCLMLFSRDRHYCVFLQVRKLDCISVLLDCCNIDARNPCILNYLILLYKCCTLAFLVLLLTAFRIYSITSFVAVILNTRLKSWSFKDVAALEWHSSLPPDIVKFSELAFPFFQKHCDCDRFHPPAFVQIPVEPSTNSCPTKSA